MIHTSFPTVETVRDALNGVKPFDPYDVWDKAGIKQHWLYAFMKARPGAGSPKYENLTKIIAYLEKERGVIFPSPTEWRVN